MRDSQRDFRELPQAGAGAWSHRSLSVSLAGSSGSRMNMVKLTHHERLDRNFKLRRKKGILGFCLERRKKSIAWHSEFITPPCYTWRQNTNCRSSGSSSLNFLTRWQRFGVLLGTGMGIERRRNMLSKLYKENRMLSVNFKQAGNGDVVQIQGKILDRQWLFKLWINHNTFQGTGDPLDNAYNSNILESNQTKIHEKIIILMVPYSTEHFLGFLNPTNPPA